MEQKILEVLMKYIGNPNAALDARKELLGLFSVSVSVLSDSEIEALADEVYLEVSKTFPIYHEYEFTQGYIIGAMAMRNRLCTER